MGRLEGRRTRRSRSLSSKRRLVRSSLVRTSKSTRLSNSRVVARAARWLFNRQIWTQYLVKRSAIHHTIRFHPTRRSASARWSSRPTPWQLSRKAQSTSLWLVVRALKACNRSSHCRPSPRISTNSRRFSPRDRVQASHNSHKTNSSSPSSSCSRLLSNHRKSRHYRTSSQRQRSNAPRTRAFSRSKAVHRARHKEEAVQLAITLNCHSKRMASICHQVHRFCSYWVRDNWPRTRQVR